MSAPEEWRAIPGFQDYEASSYGRLGSWKPLRKGAGHPIERRILKLHPDRDGYARTVLRVGNRRVSVRGCCMVALTWHGPRPDGMEVRHLDGVNTNDAPSNLAWGTRLENARDRRRHGTQICGTRVNTAKLTEAEVREIRASGGTHSSVAARYGVTPKMAWNIRNGKNWTHVNP